VTKQLAIVCAAVLSGCGAVEPDRKADAGTDAGDGMPFVSDAGSHDGGWIDGCNHQRPDKFADSVVSFDAGMYAGFGHDQYPCIVFGPPLGAGPEAGSLDVLSLGYEGSIIVSFDDVEIVDGPGPDFIVFENAFPAWIEPGFIGVSDDGVTWTEWPCEPQNTDGGYPHCGGVHAVLSNPDNGISPFDPTVAGGDAFDLADIGVKKARYVRVRDSGWSHYGGTTGGFDLDAVSAVNSEPR
jgi:hypothetical protein